MAGTGTSPRAPERRKVYWGIQGNTGIDLPHMVEPPSEKDNNFVLYQTTLGRDGTALASAQEVTEIARRLGHDKIYRITVEPVCLGLYNGRSPFHYVSNFIKTLLARMRART